MAAREFVNCEEGVFADHVEEPKTLVHVHEHGEITGELRVGLDFEKFLELLCSWRGRLDFGDVELAYELTWLAFNKTKDLGLEVVGVDQSLAEAAAVAFKELLLLLFAVVELDVAVDGLSAIWSADSIKSTPLFSAFHITYDLHRVFGGQGARSRLKYSRTCPSP